MPLFKRQPKHVQIDNPSRLQSATDAGHILGKFGVAHDPQTGNLLQQADSQHYQQVVGHAEQVGGGAWRITDASTGIVYNVAGDGTVISRQAGRHTQRRRGWGGG